MSTGAALYRGSTGTALNGNAGNDAIYGNNGADTLFGWLGVDWLSGGAGNDHFVFTVTNQGLDHVIDFAAGDSLDFSNGAFGSLGVGTLSASHFVSGATEGSFGAAGAGSWYNTADHTLYYDSNGNTSGGLTAIVVLDNGFVLQNTDVHLI